MVAVDELIQSGGGALARLIAVLSAEVVPIRERRISSRLAAVYRQLTENVSAEMDDTLPTNNGTMVWDAIEGATNFAIYGSFGHHYMFSIDAYRSLANYYYYDKNGAARITLEPWAEFFSASVMGDADTVNINLAYLPETSKYFAEELAPALRDYYRSRVLGQAA